MGRTGRVGVRGGIMGALGGGARVGMPAGMGYAAIYRAPIGWRWVVRAYIYTPIHLAPKSSVPSTRFRLKIKLPCSQYNLLHAPTQILDQIAPNPTLPWYNARVIEQSAPQPIDAIKLLVAAQGNASLAAVRLSVAYSQPFKADDLLALIAEASPDELTVLVRGLRINLLVTSFDTLRLAQRTLVEKLASLSAREASLLYGSVLASASLLTNSPDSLNLTINQTNQSLNLSAGDHDLSAAHRALLARIAALQPPPPPPPPPLQIESAPPNPTVIEAQPNQTATRPTEARVKREKASASEVAA